MQPPLSSPIRRPRLGLWLLCCLVVCCFVSGWGAAQQLSALPAELTAEESVSLSGSGLPPGSQVTVQLTAPGGGVSREGVRVGEGGRFRLETPLPVIGSYQLVVRGQGLDETRVLEVRPENASPAPPAPTRPVPAQPSQARPSQTQPTQTQPAPSLPDVRRVEGGLQATRGGALSWRLTFPARSGATTEPLVVGERLYVGHGNSVLRLEPRTGDVLERTLVSGQVERLGSVKGEVAVTVRHGGAVSERFTLRGGRAQPLRFGAEVATFGFLRAGANVRDPAARLKRDPTNPWLFLNVGMEQQNSEDPGAARASFERAVETATTFYDLAGLATVLEARGQRALAADAFDAAMEDFAARGYDPRLLTSAGLEAAYNFPLTPLKAALDRRDARSSSFWAERLELAAPRVPGADDALGEYAALLRALDTPETEAWRPSETPMIGPGLPERFAVTLGRSGWGFALALLVTFAALQLTLFAKYARARRADRGEGGRAPWLFAVRYTTLSEKLVSLLLLASVLACSALAGWQDATDPPPPALASGTLLSHPAQVFFETTELSGPAGAFVRSYTVQAAGDETRDNETAAQSLLTRAGDYALALNNLGALTGDDDLYRRALSLLPTLTAARYNTAAAAERDALLPFTARYQPGPALAIPTAQVLQDATAGSWQTALARAFTAPQLLNAPPGITTTLTLALWRTAQLLFFLVVLVTLVFLFIPRPRSVHGAPRPWAYEVLALLVPGSGSADEGWGIFLLVPWAVFGAAALSPRFGWGLELGLTPLTLLLILGGIYLLNAVAVAVEWLSHRSRQRTLERRTRPRRA